MATATHTARHWARGRVNRRALERFAAFWNALQRVGNALGEAERLAKNAEDASWWRQRNARHWSVASADEVRSALRTCRGSLRILSRSAKRFEPELIHREWKR
jgi:hypothetical protein